MKSRLRIRYFAHSWVSDWNHGNAHFLRGLVRELKRLGHEVRCYEELGAWSLRNLVHEGKIAIAAIDDFRRTYHDIDVSFYQRNESLSEFLNAELKDADVVIVHEWNDPAVVRAIMEFKSKYHFKALFHDTHHRAYSNAGDILAFPLHQFDGVLAFGAVIKRIYSDGFGVARSWVFHEAADVSVFKPIAGERDNSLVWIGNWGDEERTRELMEFFAEPASQLRRDGHFVAYGVRYPESALEALANAGIEFRGYLPNLSAPGVYAHCALALHVPRRQYANGLSGVPTIRVFEALACGVPLVCAPWTDAEALFRPGQDYVVVNSGCEMTEKLRELLHDRSAREQISASGLETIRKHHTCAHRAQQLTEICEELRA
jgi:spore maturation protein CgeB